MVWKRQQCEAERMRCRIPADFVWRAVEPANELRPLLRLRPWWRVKVLSLKTPLYCVDLVALTARVVRRGVGVGVDDDAGAVIWLGEGRNDEVKFDRPCRCFFAEQHLLLLDP